MAKQTFVADAILTAAQMNALQSNDFNQTVSAKTASYTLVAADAGTRITMNNASATTITVNTSLFAAGDTLFIGPNLGAGTCTITAGTATVSTSGSLALAQYGGGTLYFTSAGVATFFSGGAATSSLAVSFLAVGSGGGGKSGLAGNYEGGGGGGGSSQEENITLNQTALIKQTYTIVVGAGGASNANGNISSFKILTATGGLTGSTGTGGAGGSGSGTTSAGGNGGNGGNPGSAGSAGPTSSLPTGSAVNFGGGGGGAGGTTGGAGGSGGGGAGGNGVAGTAGTANKGGGGGGGSATGNSAGGAGGSGVVFVRYLTTDAALFTVTATIGTSSAVGSYTLWTFNASGTLIIQVT